jgi:hypothetical protein
MRSRRDKCQCQRQSKKTVMAPIASLPTLGSYPPGTDTFHCEQTIPILKRLGDWLGLRYE